MWIKIFPLNAEALDKEGKEEELSPILLNLDRLLMVELNSDYQTLYIQEMEPIIIRTESASAENLSKAIRQAVEDPFTGLTRLTIYEISQFLNLESDKSENSE